MQKLRENDLIKQETLKRLERMCVQEEAPACSAACPMHVDVRSFNANIACKEWEQAYMQLSKKLVFPMIIPYICDAPCQKACRRDERGGSMRINDLERVCIDHTNVQIKPHLFLPQSKHKIAIVGKGMRGMSAALTLGKKGHQIFWFDLHQEIGGRYREDKRIPDQIWKMELTRFNGLRIENFCQWVELNNINDAKNFSSEYDAIMIACPSDIKLQDEQSLQLNDEKIVVVPDSLSPIEAMSLGVRAAISIERIIKDVSVMYGRNNEGAYQSKLYVNLDQIQMAEPLEGDFDDQAAQAEAKRCIQCECMECTKGCAFMQYYQSYPRKLLREVYNNLSISMGIHNANHMIGSCNMCGQCASICPNGLDMSEVFYSARNMMMESGKMPPSYHDFAISDMIYSNGENFTMAKMPPDKQSRYAFFPSCQLAASEPNLLIHTYQSLRDQMEGDVSLMLGCCGIMAHWAGDKKLFDDSIDNIKQQWQQLGQPTIITACPTCQNTLNQYANIPTKGIWELYANGLLKLNSNDLPKGELMVHDACGSRKDEKTHKIIRNILEELGYTLREFDYNQDQAPCCGYGGLMPFVNQSLAQQVADFRLKQSPVHSKVLTYCVNCRDMFLKQQRKSVHLLELIHWDLPKDKIKHAYPTWSQRQQNRRRVKAEMLKDIWGEEMPQQQHYQLHIDDQLEQKLEQRMILHSDISNTIFNAHKNKQYFINPHNGQMTASYAYSNITFWVVYSSKGGANEYIIHNAYSHRMRIC